MFFIALAAASMLTSPIMKTPAHTTQGERFVEEETYYSYDVRRNINYRRDTSGLDKISLETVVNEPV